MLFEWVSPRARNAVASCPIAVLATIALSFGSAPNALAVTTGQISGVVTEKASHTALLGIDVCAFSVKAKSAGSGCATTNSSGEYTIEGLAGGTYGVEFSVPFESGLDYIRQYYKDKSSESEAERVTVNPHEPLSSSNIDAQLEEGGHITGNVTSAAGGEAIEGIEVCASAGPEGLCTKTNSSGEYTISALATAEYKVVFSTPFASELYYATQYYNHKSSLSEAEPVTVTAPSVTSGINVALQSTSTAPMNTAPPTVSGIPAVGDLLSCTDGLWTGRPAPTTFTDQWLRDGAPIAGATGSSYGVQSPDTGHALSCQVTAKNTKGGQSATSAGVVIPAKAIAPLPPPPEPVVKIIGLKLISSRGLARMRIECSGAICRGSVELTAQVTVKHRKGKKTVSRKQTVVLARGFYSLAAGRSGTVLLRLTHAGKRRLAHVKRHRPLTVELVVSMQGGKTIARLVRLT